MLRVTRSAKEPWFPQKKPCMSWKKTDAPQRSSTQSTSEPYVSCQRALHTRIALHNLQTSFYKGAIYNLPKRIYKRAIHILPKSPTYSDRWSWLLNSEFRKIWHQFSRDTKADFKFLWAGVVPKKAHAAKQLEQSNGVCWVLQLCIKEPYTFDIYSARKLRFQTKEPYTFC